jgi:hypothetical protein
MTAQNYTAIAADGSCITGTARDCKEACCAIRRSASALGKDIVWAFVGNAYCQYTPAEIAEIAGVEDSREF